MVRSVKIALMFNTALWFASLSLWHISPEIYTKWVGEFLILDAGQVLEGEVFRVATYMFVHSVYHPFDLIMNMLLVYFFAAPLERRWGTRRTLLFMFICGVGGGVATTLSHLLWSTGLNLPPSPTNSGFASAGLGLLAAYSILEAHTTILLAFVFPIKAKHFILLTIAMEWLFWISAGSNTPISTHLGGLATGALLVTGLWRPSNIRERWILWRHREKLKKMKGEDKIVRGPWIH